MFDEIISALILIISGISIYIWIIIIRNTKNPTGSIYEINIPRQTAQSENLIFKDFYFIPHLNVTNSSTTLIDQEGPLFPEQLAPKCRLFGKDCLGFDTNGHLLLTSDKNYNYVNIREETKNKLNKMDPGFYQFLPNSGSTFAEMCTKQMEGKLDKNKCVLSNLQLNKLINQLNKNV